MNVPPAYTLLQSAGVRALVRDDLVTRLGAWAVAPVMAVPAGAPPLSGGRGTAFRGALPDGLRYVVRPGRRGGWLGRVVRDTYVGWRPRPFVELRVACIARARGVPTPAVLAARVEGRCGVYRGVVVTEEVPDARTLAEALPHAADPAAGARLARAAGRAVASLHTAGIEHADLNLANLLVRADVTDDRIVIIDLDKGRARRGPLGRRARRRGIERFARSWRKIGGAPPPAALWSAFLAGYEGGAACVR